MTLKRVRNPVERIIYFKGMRGMFGMKNQKGGRLLGSLENYLVSRSTLKWNYTAIWRWAGYLPEGTLARVKKNELGAISARHISIVGPPIRCSTPRRELAELSPQSRSSWIITGSGVRTQMTGLQPRIQQS